MAGVDHVQVGLVPERAGDLRLVGSRGRRAVLGRAWPHLQIGNVLFLRFIVSNGVDPEITALRGPNLHDEVAGGVWLWGSSRARLHAVPTRTHERFAVVVAPRWQDPGGNPVLAAS